MRHRNAYSIVQVRELEMDHCLISIETVFSACEKDAFPERFSRNNQFVGHSETSMLEQGEAEICSAVRKARFAD